MKLKLSDLYSWNGRIDRFPFLAWGCLLFTAKFLLDRYLPSLIFSKPFNYDFFSLILGMLPNLSGSGDRGYFLTLIWIAAPFMYTGICLTVMRLRALDLTPALSVLFFVPYLNLLFFVILSVLASKPEHSAQCLGNQRQKPWYAKHIPFGRWACASYGLLLTQAMTLAISILMIYGFNYYGWPLFVGVPFVGGLNAVLFYGFHKPKGFMECMSVASLSGFFLACAFLLFAFEGVICVLLAAPLVGSLGLLGGVVGYFIQRRDLVADDFSRTSLSMLFFVPMTAFVEEVQPPPAKVVTKLEIAAPAEVVWKHLVAFPPIPEERPWLFHTGIAYPTHATIEGEGVGAVRYCHFSTGAFVEPIDIWDEPHRLAFSVRGQPDPMVEMSLFRQIHPPHLQGTLLTQKGQFLIEPLKDGGVLLTGTTWYSHELWPNIYWRRWTDWIIHKIHFRVLDHIRKVSEADAKNDNEDPNRALLIANPG